MIEIRPNAARGILIDGLRFRGRFLFDGKSAEAA
jgi:hypothetical protein